MIETALLLMAGSVMGLICAAVFINKKQRIQDDLLISHFESLRKSFDNIWNEIDVLQIQVAHLEKGEVYDPKKSHE